MDVNEEDSVDVHILIAPLSLWRSDLRCAYSSACLESVSAGFVRVSPNTSLKQLRSYFKEQLEKDVLPAKYQYLRNVGRHMALVSCTQEDMLKVSAFVPPIAAAPEVYIISTSFSASKEIHNSSLPNIGLSTSNTSSPNLISPLQRPRAHSLSPIYSHQHLTPIQPLPASSSRTPKDRRGNGLPVLHRTNERRRRAATLDGSELMRHVSVALSNISEESSSATIPSLQTQASDTTCATIASSSQEGSEIWGGDSHANSKRRSRINEKREVIATLSKSLQQTIPETLESTKDANSTMTTCNPSVTSSCVLSESSARSGSPSSVGFEMDGSSYPSTRPESVLSLSYTEGAGLREHPIQVDLNLNTSDVTAAAATLEQTLFGSRPDGEGASMCDHSSSDESSDEEDGVIETACHQPSSLTTAVHKAKHCPAPTGEEEGMQENTSSVTSRISQSNHAISKDGRSSSQNSDLLKHNRASITEEGNPYHLTDQSNKSSSSVEGPQSSLLVTPHSPLVTSPQHLSLTTQAPHSPHTKQPVHSTPLEGRPAVIDPNITMATPNPNVRELGPEESTSDQNNKSNSFTELDLTVHPKSRDVPAGSVRRPSFPTSPPLPPIGTQHASIQSCDTLEQDHQVNDLLRDLRCEKEENTELASRHKELTEEIKHARDLLNMQKEKVDQQWKKQYLQEKKVTQSLQKKRKQLEKDHALLSRGPPEPHSSTPTKDVAAPSPRSNLAMLCSRTEKDIAELQRRLAITKKQLLQEQKARLQVEDECRDLKKTLLDKKIARNKHQAKLN